MSGRRGKHYRVRPFCELVAKLLIFHQQLGDEGLQALVLGLENFNVILHGLSFLRVGYWSPEPWTWFHLGVP